jgi:chaperonin GroES
MIKPLAGYVLIEPLDEEQTTASGLVLPEKAKEKPMKGKLIGMGITMSAEDSKKKSGLYKENIVIFHRWSGQDVKDGDKDYKLVKFGDLMGVYE